MTNRFGLYVICLVGALSAMSAEDNSRATKRLLEERASQDTLRTANILGDSTPEQFYIANGDTGYVSIDGAPVRPIIEALYSASKRLSPD